MTLQYCSGFCHTLTWISHGFTCIPHLHQEAFFPLHFVPRGWCHLQVIDIFPDILDSSRLAFCVMYSAYKLSKYGDNIQPDTLFLAGLGLCWCMGFSLVAVNRGYSSSQCPGFSHCGGFSCCGTRALGHLGFCSYGSHALDHRLSSCGAWA